VLLPCSVFSAVNQCLEKGLENIHHDQEVHSIGTIHYFHDNVLYDAAHTRVILMRCYSSRPVLWFFLTGVGMSGYSTPDNCTSGLSSNRVTGAAATGGEKCLRRSNPELGAPMVVGDIPGNKVEAML
jgi:hypothetical protein